VITVELQCTCPQLAVSSPVQLLHEVDNAVFLDATLGSPAKVWYRGNEGVGHVMQTVPSVEGTGAALAPNLLLQAIHQATLLHSGVELRPEVVWYTIIHQYAEQLRGTGQLKGVSPEELQAQPIEVTSAHHVDHVRWDDIIRDVFEQLLARVDGLHAWRAKQPVSFISHPADVATIAAFVGGPNPYRLYYPVTPMAHIAKVGLGGIWDDWDMVYHRAHQLPLGLNYGVHLGEALLQIAQKIRHMSPGATVKGNSFWQKLYQYNPRDDEAPLIRGWFTGFFGHSYGQYGISAKGNNWQHHLRHPDKGWGWPASEFPSLVSTVPFVLNANAGRDVRRLTLVTGVTSVRRFYPNTLTPSLGISIIEQQPDK